MNIYKMTAAISFPEGVSIGEEGFSNIKQIATDGLGKPVLRGTALAGVIRRAYAQYCNTSTDDEIINKWFGEGTRDDEDYSSRVKVNNSLINSKSISERTHNMVNRHTGAVEKGALFQVEATLPQSTATLSIEIEDLDENEEETEGFISDLASLLENDLIVGGSSNRGIGRIKVEKGIFLRKYNLDRKKDFVKWLNDDYMERKDGVELEGELVSTKPLGDDLVLEVTFGVPRGEDILVGDGQQVDYSLQPQKVELNNGKSAWRIPGSSLRGVFRQWMTRLAAIDGYEITDSYDNYLYQTQGDAIYQADLIGWGMMGEGEDRQFFKGNALELADPILDLFGSMYKKGRLFISDSFCSYDNQNHDQARMHVAIDRFAGGANEGALFSNRVLTSRAGTFTTRIKMIMPKDYDTYDEVVWLMKTLRAIHLGILLIGSSKSSGRLEIKNIQAQGKYSEVFESLTQELN